MIPMTSAAWHKDMKPLEHFISTKKIDFEQQAAVHHTLNLIEVGKRDSPTRQLEGIMVFVASQGQRHWLGRPAGSRPRRTTPGWCVELYGLKLDSHRHCCCSKAAKMDVPISIDNLCEWGGQPKPKAEGKAKPPVKPRLEKTLASALANFFYYIRR